MKKILTLAAAICACASAGAVNPIVQTTFTPDPAPYVHGDTVYVFTGHDEDDARYFKMADWQLFSSTDMLNWTYRGTPMSTATFQWAKQGDNAWASQAIERDGRWYWYICAEDTTVGLHGIGVAVAPRPEGPYTDPLKRPLVPGGWGYIDPSVFIDDDGQAYLFWGNNGLWYARLGRDMISLDSEVMPVGNLDDESAFGPRVMKMDYQENRRKLKTGYEEGPWIYKRDGLYYLVYAAGGVPEHMAYSTSESIDGPWVYRGRVLSESPASFTIHGGSIEVDGRNFMFYHTGELPNGGGFHRSSCVEEFEYNPDGSIPLIPITREGVKTPLRNLDPYTRVEAETMADSYGLKTDRTAGSEHYITKIDNGDWLSLRSVDLGDGGKRRFTARVRTLYPQSQPMGIEVRVDGRSCGTLTVDQRVPWTEQSADVDLPAGVHDVELLFHGGDNQLFDFDWWQLF